jgi:hypothetical protein
MDAKAQLRDGRGKAGVRHDKLSLPEESVLVREIADTRRALQLRTAPKAPPGD